MDGNLPRIEVDKKSGSERFHDNGAARDFSVQDFWGWSVSDLVSNATRAILAEYIVGKAIGAVGPKSVRTEWDAYDLTSPEGVKVEVKASAFIQSWSQKDYSRPVYSVRKARSWSADTGEMASTMGRAADVYVFALLQHKDQETLDPLDLQQWRFYVVPTAVLNERRRSQHSITLRSLDKLCQPVGFDELKTAVTEAARSVG